MFLLLTAHAEEPATAPMPEGQAARMANRQIADGVRFKPGKGLQVQSDDGDFGLTAEVRMDFRYTVEQSQVPPQDVTQSYQIRRARWTLSGNVFGEHNTFKMDVNLAPKDVGWSPEDGVANGPLRDGYMRFDHLRDLALTVGQMKVPFSREFLTSSSKLMLVDRSIAHSAFTLDRDIGVTLSSKDLGGADRVRYHLGVFSGEGPYRYSQEDFGNLYVARVEVAPMGLEKHAQSDQARLLAPRLSVGAAAAYVDGAKHERAIKGSAPADGGTTDILTATTDLSFKAAGASLDAAVHWRIGKRTVGDALDETGAPIPRDPAHDALGYMAQAGYLLPGTRWEAAARYAHVAGLGNSPVPKEDEVGGGVSYYIAEHALKVQGDLFRVSEGTPDVGHLAGRLQIQAMM